MTATLTKLIRKRDRMCDELQILEMSAGWRYMLASPLNKKYEALKARISELERKNG
jgi:hypothetical protein